MLARYLYVSIRFFSYYLSFSMSYFVDLSLLIKGYVKGSELHSRVYFEIWVFPLYLHWVSDFNAGSVLWSHNIHQLQLCMEMEISFFVLNFDSMRSV